MEKEKPRRFGWLEIITIIELVAIWVACALAVAN